MALKLITPATELAVTLVEAKAHLKVDVVDDDLLITAYIAAATEAAEQITGRAIMPQTWELTLDAFPDALEITRMPAVSITSLKYYDSNGTQQTLSNSLYTLDNADDFGSAYVVPVYNGAWPDTRGQINAVALRYLAGYAAAVNVPESIKAWVKLQVGAMYENRQAEGTVQTYALGFADRLLDRYKVYYL
jgi:uncharacterized phiE125 gp8 family phage protein